MSRDYVHVNCGGLLCNIFVYLLSTGRRAGHYIECRDVQLITIGATHRNQSIYLKSIYPYALNQLVFLLESDIDFLKNDNFLYNHQRFYILFLFSITGKLLVFM